MSRNGIIFLIAVVLLLFSPVIGFVCWHQYVENQALSLLDDDADVHLVSFRFDGQHRRIICSKKELVQFFENLVFPTKSGQ